MNSLVAVLNPGTWSSDGHCEFLWSQKDSFWSGSPVLGRICDCSPG